MPNSPRTTTKFSSVMKPTAQHKAETAGIDDELGDLASDIDLAGLAVLGMAGELDDVHGYGQRIQDRLLDLADKVRDVAGRLSPVNAEATARARDKVLGKAS
jgi:hypothetical protein